MSKETATPDEPWIEMLLNVLERQSDLADELAGLADQQAALIAHGSADALLNLLARRQSIIDEFTSSQTRLGQLATGLDARLNTLEPVSRDRIKSMIEQIGKRLSHIMQQDAQDQASLRQSQSAIKQELSAIGAGRHARMAYRGDTARPARFADQHG